MTTPLEGSRLERMEREDCPAGNRVWEIGFQFHLADGYTTLISAKTGDYCRDLDREFGQSCESISPHFHWRGARMVGLAIKCDSQIGDT